MGTKRPRPVVLDASALIAVGRADRRVIRLLKLALEIHVPAATLARAWRNPARQVRLVRVVSAEGVAIHPLDEDGARAVGQLCAATASSDVVDASVVILARLVDGVTVTGDPDDLRRLDPGGQEQDTACGRAEPGSAERVAAGVAVSGRRGVGKEASSGFPACRFFAMAPKWARVWFGVTAACVLAGVVINAITAANDNGGHFHSGAARAANTFAFFTTWSNLLVGLATLLLAVRLDRSSTAFAVLRLSGLVAIIATGFSFATGVAFDAEFAQAIHLKGWGLVWNVLLHIVVPVMAVVGWLLIGPRRIVSRRVAWLSVIFPVCYIAFTLIRGAIVDGYPYPFIDVTQLGYGRVALNCVPMPLFTLGLAAAATVLDRWLARATSAA